MANANYPMANPMANPMPLYNLLAPHSLIVPITRTSTSSLYTPFARDKHRQSHREGAQPCAGRPDLVDLDANTLALNDLGMLETRHP